MNNNVGPYFNTTIKQTIGLNPNQMNKKLYQKRFNEQT